ncbi:MAG: hypothetical protein RJA44_875 [Pseudomonadota bacterium]|jgi:RNA polymerase sigma-70 factor (ECF subfamily)
MSHEACAALLGQLAPLRRYARLLCGDAARADDLLQDTLERALRKWHLYDERGSLRSWLLSIMHNLWAGQHRGRPDELSWSDEHEAAGPDTSQQLTLRLDTERALARLPEAQRAVLLLVVVEELGYAEVAEVLDIPLGTVMSRLSRARAQMRTLMADTAAPAATTAPHLRVVSDRSGT